MAKQTDPRLVQAMNAIASGQPQQAESLCLSILSEKKRDDLAMALLAQVYNSTGKYVDAIQLIRSAISKNNKRADYHGLLGDMLTTKGDFRKALDAYNKASELYPENVELLFWGAVILCTDDKFDIAKPMFEKIFKVDSDLREMVPRLENHPMFPLSEEMVKKILDITNE